MGIYQYNGDSTADKPQVTLKFAHITAAEVDIENLLHSGRDVLGIRRFSMKGKTLGTLFRLKDAAHWKSEYLHSYGFFWHKRG